MAVPVMMADPISKTSFVGVDARVNIHLAHPNAPPHSYATRTTPLAWVNIGCTCTLTQTVTRTTTICWHYHHSTQHGRTIWTDIPNAECNPYSLQRQWISHYTLSTARGSSILGGLLRRTFVKSGASSYAGRVVWSLQRHGVTCDVCVSYHRTRRSRLS